MRGESEINLRVSMTEMYGNQYCVMAWCENPDMDACLLGASVRLSFEFLSVSSASEARQALQRPLSFAVFVQCSTLGREHLALVSEFRHRPQTAIVTILDSCDEEARNSAVRAGARACFSYVDVIQNICFLVHDTVSGLRDASHESPEKRTIPLTDRISFSVPGFCIDDGRRQRWLTPTSGALLAYLAARPNEVIPKDELILAGWTSRDGATENALNQRVHYLRTRLKTYGLFESIKVVRGIGYRFEPPTLH